MEQEQSYNYIGAQKTGKGTMTKKQTIIFVLTTIFMVVFCMSNAFAQIVVDDAIVEYNDIRSPMRTVNVSNLSNNNNMVVNAYVYRLKNPGSKEATLKASKNIIVSPNTFTLNPQETKNVKLVLRVPSQEKEATYRIHFVPEQPAAQQEEFSTSKKQLVNILTGMGVLAFVSPQTKQKDFTWARDAKNITFTNNGNYTVTVMRHSHCVNNNCYEIAGKRIYPKTSWQLQLPTQVQNETMKFKAISYGSVDYINIHPGGNS